MLVPSLLSLLLVPATVPTVTAQLLFPANVPSTPDGAAQIPFHLTHSHQAGELDLSGPRIAVIGGGAAGSSAAYFLAHFGREGPGIETDVTVFEKGEYIGGRSTVVWPWEEQPEIQPAEEGEEPVECGASIVVEANKNLHKAARVFNLTLLDYAGEEGTMSIWDGTQFVYSESKGWGWGYWDLAKMFWRYGRSPLKVRSLVKTTVSSFLRLYSPAFISSGAFSSLSSFATSTNLSYPSTLSGLDYFTTEGVSPLFTTELIAAATAVNYGTPVGEIHGTGALVSLAATGAVSVKGGNRRIFEAFLGASEARLKLSKTGKVVEIVKLDAAKGARAQWVVKTEAGAVILSAPFHQTSISIHNSPLPTLIPPQPYVNLHVTFIITNSSSPSPAYFNLPPTTSMPKSIFASFDTPSAESSPPAFNSLNYLRQLSSHTSSKFGEGDWHVVKMFSKSKLSAEVLGEIFGGKENVGRSWEKVWLAYPKLKPIVEAEKELAPVRPDEGFYYSNGFERLISTMETETVASFNAVSLLLQDFFGYTPPASWAEWGEQE
ncbi:Prenylcysteine lyase-domain-containing protein [Leucosporidium creatinivorum]|uniref:Prenylcysteine lyase-domain-containing protein n=1 Tax=Leucosporidium creatinivorum TaxID=106004 RepID=A0A1Y2D6V7_9BASI|nr:Prenylcysteine lyase-domain-containing protein [Leucosporidium creatinivorum]